MSEFKTPLKVRLLPETEGIELWQLLEPLTYQSDLLGTVTVPDGFITDFVSMKALNFTAHRPACLHDYAYCCKDITREQADDLLKESLGTIGMNPELIELMFLGVRAFGSSHRTEADLIYTLKGE